MKIKSIVVTGLLSAVLSANSQAQEKYCGSGITSYIVPDTVTLACVGFTASCKTHDTCYGVCSDEDVDKKAGCETATRSKRRLACDSSFIKEMDGSCVAAAKGNAACRAACGIISNLYYGAVRLVGGAISGFRGEVVTQGDFKGAVLPAGISPNDPKGIGSTPDDDKVQRALSSIVNHKDVDKSQPVTAGVAGRYAVFVFGAVPKDGKLSLGTNERVLYANAVDITDLKLATNPLSGSLSAQQKRIELAKRLAIGEGELMIVTFPGS